MAGARSAMFVAGSTMDVAGSAMDGELARGRGGERLDRGREHWHGDRPGEHDGWRSTRGHGRSAERRQAKTKSRGLEKIGAFTYLPLLRMTSYTVSLTHESVTRYFLYHSHRNDGKYVNIPKRSSGFWSLGIRCSTVTYMS